MNLRTHKRNVYARIWQTFPAGRPVGTLKPGSVLEHRMAMEALLEPKVPVYSVFRLKDGVEVLNTESLEAARELVEKHARQKKAKLVVHDDMGELVLFADEAA